MDRAKFLTLVAELLADEKGEKLEASRPAIGYEPLPIFQQWAAIRRELDVPVYTDAGTIEKALRNLT